MKNKIRVLVFTLMTACTSMSFAIEACKEKTEEIQTPLGTLAHVTCDHASNRFDQYVLNGKVVYQGTLPLMTKAWYPADIKAPTKYYVFSTGDLGAKTLCPDRLVLLDLSGDKPRAFNFGVHAACMEFKSAKMTKNGFQITLKPGARFIYKDGRFQLPEPIDAIEGTMATDAYKPTSEQITPYATEVHFQ